MSVLRRVVAILYEGVCMYEFVIALYISEIKIRLSAGVSEYMSMSNA